MVGPPKTLYDLRKVEAALRVTCRACGGVKLVDREALIADRRFSRRSLEWPAVLSDLPCPICSSADVKVAGVPFAEDAKELREYRARALLMNLALTVLNDAARRATEDDVHTAAVRLALRALRPFLADRDLLMKFWEESGAPKGRAYNHAHLVHRWIVSALVSRGHPVWAEFR
ncbi:hypothetical protein [Sphingomonas adhaesiva]|uniref:hypothetical protein n=1 Tax=Sphingomonas adhaesiva TaxID=28212 RepID=UPI002FFA38AE